MAGHAKQDIYLQIDPKDVWRHFGSLSGIFRGGGGVDGPGGGGPRLVRKSGVRLSDFLTAVDEGEIYALRHSGYGLSLSTSIARLKGETGVQKITGWVWKIEKGTEIPDGLCINYDRNDPDHPLLGVSRKMKISELEMLLGDLSLRMKKTNTKIT